MKLITTEEISTCREPELLISALRECALDLIANVSRMAQIIKRLDELNVTIEIDSALLPYLRLIASGKLSAKCFAACVGEPELLCRVTSLPLKEQEKIADNTPIPFVTKQGEIKQIPITQVPPSDLSVVFGKTGRLRTVADQQRVRGARKSRETACQVGRGVRCGGCGAKLMPGCECLKCKLDRGAAGEQTFGIPGEMPEGWQERLSEISRAKTDGDCFEYHANRVLSHLENAELFTDDDWATCMELYRAIKKAIKA